MAVESSKYICDLNSHNSAMKKNHVMLQISKTNFSNAS